MDDSEPVPWAEDTVPHAFDSSVNASLRVKADEPAGPSKRQATGVGGYTTDPILT